MTDQPKCQCQSAGHGHNPGECPIAADPQKEDMCEACHNHALAGRAEILKPLNEPATSTGLNAAVTSTVGKSGPTGS